MTKDEQEAFKKELRYIEITAKSINGRMYSMRHELSEIMGLSLRLQNKLDALTQETTVFATPTIVG